MDETRADRARRHRLRAGFDKVADLYAITRSGYPRELVDLVVQSAGLGDESVALEIGCGTGQLTRSLAGRGFTVTALDLSPAMIARARAEIDDAAIEFVVCAFEDFSAEDDAFDLIVSATACHWVDPEVTWDKAARLLRSGGWVALLETMELYDEPVRSAIRATWKRHVGDEWADRPAHTVRDRLAAGPLFEVAVEHTHVERRSIDVATVIGVEETRATWLDWDDSNQASFDAELRRVLGGLERVDLEQHTSLAMARATS